MKLVITVETPNDDKTHYTRIGSALREYVMETYRNNEKPFRPGSFIGLTGGPHVMLWQEHGIRLTARRVDLAFLFSKALNPIRRLLGQPIRL